MPIELSYIRKNVRTFVEFMDPLIEDSENLGPAELIGLLRTSLDLDRYVTEEDIPSPDDVKIQNLNQLQLAATRFKDIPSFLEYTETFEDEAVSDNKEGVSLMTIHKAKGLEFPVVFVIGLVEGILPSKKGIWKKKEGYALWGCPGYELLYLSHTLTYLGQASKRSYSWKKSWIPGP